MPQITQATFVGLQLQSNLLSRLLPQPAGFLSGARIVHASCDIVHAMERMFCTDPQHQTTQQLLEHAVVGLHARGELVHKSNELVRLNLAQLPIDHRICKVRFGVLQPDGVESERIIVVIIAC